MANKDYHNGDAVAAVWLLLLQGLIDAVLGH